MPDTDRIDRWLWAVRIYKTRSQAASACRLNQVRVDGQFVKPSRPVGPGTTIQIEKDQMIRTVKVLTLAEKRIGAKLVQEHIDDITPEEELERSRAVREQLRLNRVYQVRGEGRPSKKQRREIEKFLDIVEISTELDKNE
ncbi:MAG: ribosome-associated heat shock protein Hsp15 [Verrucomicrobiales bacterium]|jgi:ribosome-associated heat shock protein Hsp15